MHRMTGFRLLQAHLQTGHRTWAAVLGWSLVETGPALASGWVVARAVDEGFLAGRPGVGLAYLALLGGLHVLRAVAERTLFRHFADIVEPLRDGLVERVVESSLSSAAQSAASHSTEPDTATVARLTGQVESVRMLAGALLRLTRPVVINVMAAAIGLCTLAPSLVVVIAPALLVVAVAYPLSIRSLVRTRRAMVLTEEDLSARTGSVVLAARDVSATGATDRAVGGVAVAAIAHAAATVAQARAATSRVLLTTVGGRLPLVLVLGLAPAQLAGGTATAGELLGAVVYLTTQLIPALSTLTGFVSDYWTQLGVLLGRLAETTAGPSGPTRPSPAPGGAVHEGAVQEGAVHEGSVHLRAERVGFAYGPGAAPVVEDLTLVVPAGEHLAIVGASGIGKSTVAALLAGVEAPDSGRVLVSRDATGTGAVDVSGLCPTDRRRTVAVVPQQAYIVEGTLRENLTYLSGPVPDPVLDDAAARTGLRVVVDRLGGYDAVIGDPAGSLGPGDRQLVAVTRTLLARAALVVLDEATCNLGAREEAVAEAAFRVEGATLVVVAHRLEAALRSDRVLLLHESGADVGTHAELLARSSPYRVLWASAVQPALPV